MAKYDHKCWMSFRKKLCQHIITKRRAITRSWVLHHDNTRPHPAKLSSEILDQHDITTMLQSHVHQTSYNVIFGYASNSREFIERLNSTQFPIFGKAKLQTVSRRIILMCILEVRDARPVHYTRGMLSWERIILICFQIKKSDF